MLTGFSYGAMATMYALYAQVADKLGPPLANGERLRFAGHAAFYGPCIARFDDSRTTGAPLLMLIGGRDAITDQRRCAEIAADLRAGGSRVETHRLSRAVHQWDGAFAPRLIGRNLRGLLAPGRARRHDPRHPYRPRDVGPFTRKIILGLCTLVAGPYPIGRDDRVRAQASADYGRFLAGIFAAPTPTLGCRMS